MAWITPHTEVFSYLQHNNGHELKLTIYIFIIEMYVHMYFSQNLPPLMWKLRTSAGTDQPCSLWARRVTSQSAEGPSSRIVWVTVYLSDSDATPSAMSTSTHSAPSSTCIRREICYHDNNSIGCLNSGSVKCVNLQNYLTNYWLRKLFIILKSIKICYISCHRFCKYFYKLYTTLYAKKIYHYVHTFRHLILNPSTLLAESSSQMRL